MKIQQLSIFVENQIGRLAEITRTLADSGIDIKAFSVADTSDFGILRLIVTDNEKAYEALSNAGFTVTMADVIGVGITDTPGALASVMECLGKNGISIEYLYAFIAREDEKAYVIFNVDKWQQAEEVLTKGGFPVLQPEQVREM
ncbi:MAG: ACT domain-containing protein [Clostridia bacterium]|nr:ACT domain-containing protein [Clostridia bacterium]